MALRSARALPLSALLLLPIANAAITRAPWSGERLSARIPRLLRQSPRTGRAASAASPSSPWSCLPPSVSCPPARSPPTSSPSLPTPTSRRCTPVRPRQIRRLSDLPFERHSESLLRWPQRSLRRRIPQAVLAPGTGPPGWQPSGIPAISPTPCCPPMPRCFPLCNRPAGAPFIRTKPRLYLYLAELNRSRMCYNRTSAEYQAGAVSEVCPTRRRR